MSVYSLVTNYYVQNELNLNHVDPDGGPHRLKVGPAPHRSYTTAFTQLSGNQHRHGMTTLMSATSNPVMSFPVQSTLGERITVRESVNIKQGGGILIQKRQEKQERAG